MARPMLVLRGVEDDTRVLELGARGLPCVLRVGRAPDNDLVLKNKSVSGRHAVVEVGGPPRYDVTIRDSGSDGRGSRFGTFVGEEHLKGSAAALPLNAVVRFGTAAHGACFVLENDDDEGGGMGDQHPTSALDRHHGYERDQGPGGQGRERERGRGRERSERGPHRPHSSEAPPVTNFTDPSGRAFRVAVPAEAAPSPANPVDPSIPTFLQQPGAAPAVPGLDLGNADAAGVGGAGEAEAAASGRARAEGAAPNTDGGGDGGAVPHMDGEAVAAGISGERDRNGPDGFYGSKPTPRAPNARNTEISKGFIEAYEHPAEMVQEHENEHRRSRSRDRQGRVKRERERARGGGAGDMSAGPVPDGPPRGMPKASPRVTVAFRTADGVAVMDSRADGADGAAGYPPPPVPDHTDSAASFTQMTRDASNVSSRPATAPDGQGGGYYSGSNNGVSTDNLPYNGYGQGGHEGNDPELASKVSQGPTSRHTRPRLAPRTTSLSLLAKAPSSHPPTRPPPPTDALARCRARGTQCAGQVATGKGRGPVCS